MPLIIDSWNTQGGRWVDIVELFDPASPRNNANAMVVQEAGEVEDLNRSARIQARGGELEVLREITFPRRYFTSLATGRRYYTESTVVFYEYQEPGPNGVHLEILFWPNDIAANTRNSLAIVINKRVLGGNTLGFSYNTAQLIWNARSFRINAANLRPAMIVQVRDATGTRISLATAHVLSGGGHRTLSQGTGFIREMRGVYRNLFFASDWNANPAAYRARISRRGVLNVITTGVQTQVSGGELDYAFSTMRRRVTARATFYRGSDHRRVRFTINN